MNNLIESFDFYMLRLPAMSISDIYQLHEYEDINDLTRKIQALYRSKQIQEAIYLASPELYQEMIKWVDGPIADPRFADGRLLLSLYKYLLRMSSRCTPYGLFAGFCGGKIIEGSTEILFKKKELRNNIHARLDMNYVSELTKDITRDPYVKMNLKFFINNSIYKTADTYRYYEYELRGKKRNYLLVSVRSSKYLEMIIRSAASGESINNLRDQLVEMGIDSQSANAYLDKLIDAQILLSELEPMVTGGEFYNYLIEYLEEKCPNYTNLASLQKIRGLLNEKKDIEAYQQIQIIINKSFPTATSNDLIQVDLHLDLARNVLNKKIINHLSTDLSSLSDLYNAGIPIHLKEFISSFHELYEGQEIPLLEALDSETGIGYGGISGANINHTPLIADISLPSKSTTENIAWTKLRQLVFLKFQTSNEQGQSVVTITDADLKTLAGKANKPESIPTTLMVSGSLLSDNRAALDDGNFKFLLQTCYGPGALRYLARFALAEPMLAEAFKSCTEREQEANNDAILAEIVHLPDARLGNIIQRPQIHEYEIPFLGNSSVPADKQIPVSDLLISIRNGQVILRSKRLNKEVIPTLTTAHNYHNGLPIYRFLCDLYGQNKSFYIRWDWGTFENRGYLPRVEYKHIIISRARWLLQKSSYNEIISIDNAEKRDEFLNKFKLPRQVMLSDSGDNELLLDFTCLLAIKILAQALNKGPVILREFLHEKSSTLLQDDEKKSYVNEIIIPFASTYRKTNNEDFSMQYPEKKIKRIFSLGSEWTYLKIYCGNKWADKILTDYLLPCIMQLSEKIEIKKWFFIRYADRKNHIRLRFLHSKDPINSSIIIDQIHNALEELQQNRIIHTIQYDTYQREIERYGSITMEFSETVFFHDSKTVINFLNLIEGEEGEQYRWLFAIRGVDQLLEDFALSLDQKIALIDNARHGFFAEFNGDDNLKHNLDNKYRKIGRLLSTFLSPENDTLEIREATNLFDARSSAVKVAYANLKLEYQNKGINMGIETIIQNVIPSYLHMFLNRIFIANQRLHELVVYHYLSKYYKSISARSKQNKLPIVNQEQK